MFLLRTFGALELTTENGDAVAGAAAQRKPLLILALAALVPGGIPRERLLRALWPGVERDRARATLKQHLYALRRATGNPNIVSGSPRLRVAADTVRVDALEFGDHVEHGRLRDAAALMRGELFEDLRPPAGEMLVDVIREIRETYASRMSMVRHAATARREAPVAPPSPATLAVVGAERELAAAVRRFARGLITLPDDPVAAQHRAIWTTHDLLEALRASELAGLGAPDIHDLLADAVAVWRRSDLVQQMIASPPGQSGAADTIEWLLEGTVQTTDPVGRALELHLLDSGLATMLRTRARWESSQLVTMLGAEPPQPFSLLLLAPHVAGDLVATVPLLQRLAVSVVVSEPDVEAVELTRYRLANLGDRLSMLTGDAFARVEELTALGPFDLILAGGTLDHLTARPATWLVEHLVRLLKPGGVLCASSLATDGLAGPWLRHIAQWSLAERDQDDIVVLTGSAAGQCDITWDRDPAGHGWLVSLRRHRVDERYRATLAPRPMAIRERTVPLT